MDQQHHNESQQVNNNDDGDLQQIGIGKYADLLGSGDGADVFFQVGEEKELISAHKHVLSAVCKVFKSRFSKITRGQAQNGTEHKPIKVPDVSPDAFRAFLRFIYTGDFSSVNKQNVSRVYLAAIKYGPEALLNACRDFLLIGQNLDEKNVLLVRLLAQLHTDDEVLTSHCLKFVANNARVVMGSDAFSKLRWDEWLEMFSHDIPEFNELKSLLLNTGKCADIHFLVGRGEGKELISAHKFILSVPTNLHVRDAAFLNTFMVNMARWTKGTDYEPILPKTFRAMVRFVYDKPVEQPDVRPDAFRTLLRFIYCKQFSGVNKQNVLDVYGAGKKFGILALVEKCRQLLLMDGQQNCLLDADNVLSVLKHAKRHEDTDLTDHCVSFVKTRMQADVFFQFGEEKELISAHKFMLIEGSPVFAAQFHHANSNLLVREGSTKKKPIPVPDVRPGTFRAMLAYIYANDLSGINKQNVLDVYYAGAKYMINALVSECRQLLMMTSFGGHSYLGVDNMFSVLKHAQRYKDDTLVNHCWTFLDRNFASMPLENNEFFELNQTDLCELLGRSTLRADELTRFCKLHRWAIHKCVVEGLEQTAESKQKLVGEAIYQIRFPLLTQQQFTNQIVPSGLLTNEDIIAMLFHYSGNIAGTGSNGLANLQYPNRFNCQPRLFKKCHKRKADHFSQ